MVDHDFTKNGHNNNNNKKLEKSKFRLLVISVMTCTFILFAFVYVTPVILNHRIEAAGSGNSTHQASANKTALQSNATAAASKKESMNTNANSTKNKSNSTITAKNTNSSTSQPNSNVTKLTTTQGNITTNANAPGSPFPPKEANSTTYFPTTNKVAIVVGAALLRDKAYQPNPVNVKAGGVVTWTNEDTVVHTVTSGTGLQDPHLGNQFDSGMLGGHFSHIFFKAGLFPYFCQIHPTMVGKVIVK